MVADALSRIKLDSSELRDLVMTRARTKELDKINQQTDEQNTSVDDWTDHPGLVELLQRPKDAIELKFTKKKKSNNLHFDKKLQVIYINQIPRSASAVDASLRDLKELCIKANIAQLCIFKQNKNDGTNELINIFAKHLNNIKIHGLKINIVTNATYICDKERQQLIINDFHMLPTGGHAGINRTYKNIRRYYFWPGLKTDIDKFISKCDDCQRYKHSLPRKEPITITTTASSAFQKVFLDLVGPLEQDILNNKYILTIQCDLTKFVEAYPIPNRVFDCSTNVCE